MGLGKTIQVGMILAELIRRGQAERILVLTKKSMLKQFQAELWNKFNIPLIRMDSDAITRLKTKIPANKNPFDIYHRVILSIDTLKQSVKYEHFLEQSNWDVVVIDEAHNVAGATNVLNNNSYRLARLLSRKATHFFLTTATPHNGKKATFGRLLGLVDPASMPDPDMEKYDIEDIEEHLVMRFKQDVKNQIEGEMKDVQIIPLHKTSTNVSRNEESILSKIATLRNLSKNKRGGSENLRLLQYGLYKLFLSSPEAVKYTVDSRLQKLSSGVSTPEIDLEKEKLDELKKLLQAEQLKTSSRYHKLKQILKEIEWNGMKNSPRILIFTEYVKTAKALALAISEEFSLNYNPSPEEPSDQKILMIDGSTPEDLLMRSVEAFATGGTSVRILIATDVASEGINLHNACHTIIHYDLPWSVITLIQRNGRIDRIGQRFSPTVRYIKVNSGVSEFSSDERVFEKLTEKVTEINLLRKEAASVLNLFDEKKEEEYIGDKIISGSDIDSILQTPAVLADGGILEMEAFLNELLKQSPAQTNLEITNRVWKEVLSNKEFFIQGYNFLKELYSDEFTDLEIQDEFLGFIPPMEVKKRLGSNEIQSDLIYGASSLPSEVWKVNKPGFRLSWNSTFVSQAILAASNDKEKGHWSDVSFLNHQNPILLWLTERLILEFNRGEAPLILSSLLPKGNFYFVFVGQISSVSGKPLLVLPHVIRMGEKNINEIVPFNSFMDSLQWNKMVNINVPVTFDTAEILLPKAVNLSKKFTLEEMDKLHSENSKRSTQYLRKLNKWKEKKKKIIEDKMVKVVAGQQKLSERKKELLEEVDKYFTEKARVLKERLEHTGESLTELLMVVEGKG